jgi:hypothetical protein
MQKELIKTKIVKNGTSLISPNWHYMPMKKVTRLTGHRFVVLQYQTNCAYRKYTETSHVLCSDGPIINWTQAGVLQYQTNLSDRKYTETSRMFFTFYHCS